MAKTWSLDSPFLSAIFLRSASQQKGVLPENGYEVAVFLSRREERNG